MKCPRCWGDALFEEYEFKKNEKKWVHKIYCPICYHREVLNITGDEPLEDKIEFSLQTWLRNNPVSNVKQDIIDCFRTGKIYHTGTVIEYDGEKVKLDLTIKKKE